MMDPLCCRPDTISNAAWRAFGARHRRFVVLGALLGLLLGPLLPPRQAIAANGATTEVHEYTVLVSRFRAAYSEAVVGVRRSGKRCGNQQDIRFTQSTLDPLVPGLTAAIEHDLQTAGYASPKAIDSAFSDEMGAKAPPDFEIGVTVRDIALDYCAHGQNMENVGAHVLVEWEMFVPAQRKVVASYLSEGQWQSEPRQEVTAVQVGRGLGHAAMHALLVDTSFPARLSQPPVQPLMADMSDADIRWLSLAHQRSDYQKQGALSAELPAIRSATVSVDTGVSHGSGFYISKEGYLLTNRHVVGDSRYVTVNLPTGRSVPGEVVRSQASRDVALIKTEPVMLPTLAISSKAPVVGDDVYAIGAPVSDALAGSVTRGVLSGTRLLQGQPWLQSDVRVAPGSSGGPLLGVDGAVIGIATSGMMAGLEGINLFVPIQDALSALHIGSDREALGGNP